MENTDQGEEELFLAEVTRDPLFVGVTFEQRPAGGGRVRLQNRSGWQDYPKECPSCQWQGEAELP